MPEALNRRGGSGVSRRRCARASPPRHRSGRDTPRGIPVARGCSTAHCRLASRPGPTRAPASRRARPSRAPRRRRGHARGAAGRARCPSSPRPSLLDGGCRSLPCSTQERSMTRTQREESTATNQPPYGSRSLKTVLPFRPEMMDVWRGSTPTVCRVGLHAPIPTWGDMDLSPSWGIHRVDPVAFARGAERRGDGRAPLVPEARV